MATSDIVQFLKTSCHVYQCEEIYIANTGHQDIILQMMFNHNNGPTQSIVLQWIQSFHQKQLKQQEQVQQHEQQSINQKQKEPRNDDNNNTKRRLYITSRL
jgi:hypothetical protein